MRTAQGGGWINYTAGGLVDEAHERFGVASGFGDLKHPHRSDTILRPLVGRTPSSAPDPRVRLFAIKSRRGRRPQTWGLPYHSSNAV
jgi:hypothetical protein